MRLFNRLFSKDDPNVRVVMINSVDEYIAGHAYDLPATVADAFIVRGYAVGDLSKTYTTDELTALYANPQQVGV